MGELKQAMTQVEFERWQQFYMRHPFDDHHRYQRPAVLVAQSMAGGDVKQKFEFLTPPVEEEPDGVNGLSSADVKTIIALGGTIPNV